MLGNSLTDITIRKAVDTDLYELSDFIKPFVDKGDLLPRTFDELEDFLDTFFIAFHDGRIVGCAALEVYNKKLCEIRSLAVDPNTQGMGVGKKLVRACVELANKEGIYEIMAISAAENFFKACGFDFTLPNLKKAFFLQTRDSM
jgi:amino-acid N-acetyltransferase